MPDSSRSYDPIDRQDESAILKEERQLFIRRIKPHIVILGTYLINNQQPEPLQISAEELQFLIERRIIRIEKRTTADLNRTTHLLFIEGRSAGIEIHLPDRAKALTIITDEDGHFTETSTKQAAALTEEPKTTSGISRARRLLYQVLSFLSR